MALTIRHLQTLAEVHACEALQRRIWNMPDDLEVVPLHLMVTVQRNGGLLLGAFKGGELAGFVFSFPGLVEDGRRKLCSHMMGVVPELQSTGIGLRLKQAQREWALSQGYDLVTWTYDPLESVNAHLNIHRLGAVCQTYIRDYYGPLADGLNAGLPSDRFQVEWWIADGRVQERLGGESGDSWPASLPRANATICTSGGLLAPGMVSLDLQADAMEFEIPADYQTIKASDPGLAMEWRMVARTVFETCFAAGYRVTGFRSSQLGQSRRSSYVLKAD